MWKDSEPRFPSLGTGLAEAVIERWRGELHEAAPWLVQRLEMQGVDDADGPTPASSSRRSSAPGQVTSRCGPHLEGRMTMPAQDGSRVVSGSLDPRILPASLQALPCYSARGADPPPHDVRGLVCLQGPGQWPDVSSAICLSLPHVILVPSLCLALLGTM